MDGGDAELPRASPEAVFSALRPHCAQLLDLLQNPGRTAPFLPDMVRLLRRVPPPLLQRILDYVLLPLLLLLDAAVECRSGREGASDDPARDLRVRDDAAEGALACLEELLRKCRLGSVDQMVTILKKLAKGAMLLPSQSSEEFREGIVLCLRALLLNLEPCSVESCKCRQVSVSHLLTDNERLPLQPESNMDSKECLLAFLRFQDASAAVGHWLSLLFQTAEAEVARGLRGSAKLRKEALLTLRVLITKVGDSDALAFFLPGVVSRFSKALHESKNTLSGAASSSESIEHAVRGLAEFLSIVLRNDASCHALDSCLQASNCFDPKENQSSHSVMEALRGLRDGSTELLKDSFTANMSSETDVRIINAQSSSKIMFVNRTGNWIKETAAHVDKFLSATFPRLCLHPSERVKKGVLDAIMSLLTNCTVTLRSSKLMLLECLCVLASDDLETVSAAAQDTIASVLVLSENFFTQDEITDVLNRLIENLPKVVLGNEETVAISHAQKLFALMYYLGPEQLVSSILCSPMKVGHFLDVMASCMSPSSQFAGPVRRLALSEPLKVGYLHSIRELKAGAVVDSADRDITPDPIRNSRVSLVKGSYSQIVSGTGDYKIPSVPPWCAHAGSQKLYASLAGIVRLIGLSVLSGTRSRMTLSAIIDTPLDSVRKLISDIRMKEYNIESWRSWYARSNSGQLLRNASTAVRILNELIYGVSDESIHLLSKLFQKNCSKIDVQGNKNGSCILSSISRDERFQWDFLSGNDIKDNLANCIGNILYEYMAHEIWNLPVDHKSFFSLHCAEEDPPLYLFHDVAVLHQIIIDGIGIFNLSLGIGFKTSGFMHNSLFLLLQKLICSNNLVKTACDAVLKVISTVAGYPSVGNLVVANADYIVDCLCRNLRHLDVDPQIPYVLSSMLSFVGVAQEILPLLEEPMRLVSLELEVLGRYQHPKLTDPFLKALLEITKASKLEACQLPSKYESFSRDIKSNVLRMKQKNGNNCSENAEFKLEHWEDVLLKLREMRRYRRIVGSVAGSCLKAAIPLIASKGESICLVALDVIEYGSSTLACVERAYKLEKESKEAIDEAIELCSFKHLRETADFAEEGDENRLLPAVNKIWPYLIICLKNKTSVAAMRRCMQVVSSIIQLSGGDFFVRRFRSDGTAIWQLLSSSPFRRKPLPRYEGQPILLPYRRAPVSQESMAEVSNLKIQEAALNMIADIASNKNSSTAIEAVLKKVSGLVVGIACSTIVGLHDASTRALSALACMDADLIWLLLADIYYSLKKADVAKPPISTLPAMHELLPQPSSSKDYLYLQYGGEGFGFDVDPSAVETIFQRMKSEEFSRAPERSHATAS